MDRLSEFRIIPARVPDDMNLVRELFLEYAHELGVDLCFQGFQEELTTLPGLYASPLGTLLLAFLGPMPVGCVALRPRDTDTCEMKRMYVRPSTRGSGMGRKLAEQIIAEASRLGYRRMVLDTLDHMKVPIKLYQSLGFKACPSYYHNPLPGVIYMEKHLSPQ